ncbi:uncharacterized protein LOC123901996 [Trifolium pratense]|uniref:uncharacterized protein LOC123901996 n=1 Tax=Trifolium pratense TaxID=57577 RepID=UPI001E697C9D|nr:uncharacterized protein LOC123901996 [Trifolium pratense]
MCLLKSALSTLRHRAAAQVFHHKLGKEGLWAPRVHPPNQSFTDPSSYHTQSVLLIMFPLLASTSMLILLARDKYINRFSRFDWSQEDPKKDFMTKPIREWTDEDKYEYFIARYKRFGTSSL